MTYDNTEMMNKSEVRHGSDNTHHEEIYHPNEDKSMISDAVSRRPSYLLTIDTQPNSWVDSAFVKWFAKFDEEKIRPFLIYKYNLDKVMAEDRYEDLVKD